MRGKIAAALASLLLLATAASPALALDLRQLIREVEEQYMGVSSKARMTMQVRTEHWERTLEMEAWSLGRDYFLTRILAPPKERGVATLKVDQEVWNYLPKVDRVIKIPPSMLGGAWMGSHITNDDLVKANQIDRDYDFTLLEETDELWHIEGIPKPDAAVIWGRIEYTVEKERRVPLVISYFDEEGLKVRDIVFDEVRAVDGRTIPMRMTVQPSDEPAERTVMHYTTIDFDIGIEESFFSLRNLKKR